jgi:APA family basic amino acid/polyamine antiporter
MQEPKLIRAAGFKEIVAFTINSIIGAGIFALPATAAKLLGVASPIAFVLAGLVAMMVVLCFAELGGRYDRTGGAYLYATSAFGSGLFSFLIGWMYFLARLTSVAALSNAMVDFIRYLFPIAVMGRAILILVTIVAIGAVNYVGIRLSTRMINAFTVAKLLPLLLFIGVGFFFINWRVYEAVTFPGLRPLSQTLLIAIFVFSGFEIVGVPAGEILDPQKTLPRGMLAGTIVTIAFYFLIQLVAVANHPNLGTSTSPIAESASLFAGSRGAAFITIGAVISTIGTILALVLAGPRILFAMALEGQMPPVFGKIHSQFRTPHLAILIFSAAAALIALSGKFAELATLSAMARLVTYIGSAAALLRLRRHQPSPETFRAPGGAFLPILVIVLSLYLLTAASRAQLIAGVIALIAGIVIFAAQPARPRKPDDESPAL